MAFGFDVASEESRLQAAFRARDSGEPTATAPIELVQETGSQMSILYFLPVYAPRPSGWEALAPGLPSA